jgi:hypothetical protein
MLQETYSCNILRSLGQRFKIFFNIQLFCPETFLQTYYLLIMKQRFQLYCLGYPLHGVIIGKVYFSYDLPPQGCLPTYPLFCPRLDRSMGRQPAHIYVCSHICEHETMMNYIHAKETAIHAKNKAFVAFVD